MLHVKCFILGICLLAGAGCGTIPANDREWEVIYAPMPDTSNIEDAKDLKDLPPSSEPKIYKYWH